MLKKQRYLFFIASTFIVLNCFSQDDLNLKVSDTIIQTNYDFDPLSPARAAFYSAVLPGLGQAYNKKYWKVPIVWAAIGTGVYFYTWNLENYHKYRDAYKLRLNGKEDDYSYLSDEALESAQRSYKNDADLSLLVTVGLYALQIIEASVNAHLLNHNVDDNLSFQPKMIQNKVTKKSVFVASINYKF